MFSSQSTLKVVFRANINRYMTLSTARSILQAFNYSSTSTESKRLFILYVFSSRMQRWIQQLTITLLQVILPSSSVLGIDQTFTLIPRTLFGVKLLIIRIANVPFWIAHILGYILRQSLLNQQAQRQSGSQPTHFQQYLRIQAHFSVHRSILQLVQ